MINIRAIISFWVKILGFFVVFVFTPIFLLSILTELNTQSAPVTTWPFWAAVGINMLPITLTVVIVFWLAARFIRDVYRLNSIWEGLGFLMRHRFGKPGFRPFIKIDHGQIPPHADSTLISAGGRGSLIVGNDSAVVLEQGGRLSGVLAPGFHILDPFEKIYDVVDLRPKCFPLEVKAMSNEGILVTWKVEVRYQIASGWRQPTPETPYPSLITSVLRASTSKWRREREGGKLKDIMDWEKLVVISRTEGTLRSIVARYPLDKLIDLDPAGRQTIRESIRQELLQTLPARVHELGARILDVELGNLQVEDEVTRQWIKAWQVRLANLTPDDSDQKKETVKIVKAQAEPLRVLNREISKLDSNQTILSMILMYFFNRIERERSENGSKMLNYPPYTRPSAPPLPPAPPFVQPQPVLSSDKSEFIMRLPIIDEIAAGREKSTLDDVMGYMQQIGETEFRIEGQTEEQILSATLLSGSKITFQGEYNYFAMPVSGDSMDQAGISPGDYVILRKATLLPTTPNNRDIAAVVMPDDTDDNKATLKRIFIETDKIMVGTENNALDDIETEFYEQRLLLKTIIVCPESSNPEHKVRTFKPPEILPGEDPNLRFVGIAVAVLKKTVMH